MFITFLRVTSFQRNLTYLISLACRGGLRALQWQRFVLRTQARLSVRAQSLEVLLWDGEAGSTHVNNPRIICNLRVQSLWYCCSDSKVCQWTWFVSQLMYISSIAPENVSWDVETLAHCMNVINSGRELPHGPHWTHNIATWTMILSGSSCTVARSGLSHCQYTIIADLYRDSFLAKHRQLAVTVYVNCEHILRRLKSCNMCLKHLRVDISRTHTKSCSCWAGIQVVMLINSHPQCKTTRWARLSSCEAPVT